MKKSKTSIRRQGTIKSLTKIPSKQSLQSNDVGLQKTNLKPNIAIHSDPFKAGGRVNRNVVLGGTDAQGEMSCFDSFCSRDTKEKQSCDNQM